MATAKEVDAEHGLLVDTTDINFIYRIEDEEMEEYKQILEKGKLKKDPEANKFTKEDIHNIVKNENVPNQTLTKLWDLCAVYSPDNLNR